MQRSYAQIHWKGTTPGLLILDSTGQNVFIEAKTVVAMLDHPGQLVEQHSTEMIHSWRKRASIRQLLWKADIKGRVVFISLYEGIDIQQVKKSAELINIDKTRTFLLPKDELCMFAECLALLSEQIPEFDALDPGVLVTPDIISPG